MKKSTIIIRSASCLLILSLSLGMGIPEAEVLGLTTDPTLQQAATVSRQNTVKIALLLDTSNSMDGLINQAKAQLWDIVNQFSHVHCQDDRRPGLQIALYQYGNDDLSPGEGYIRQVTGFTGDLDELSEKLFSLSTNGGEEFCGQVIQASLGQLDWGKDPRDLKMIFIAGNEPFTQGRLDYRDAVANAREKDVIVNTIFCGDYTQGVNSRWQEGAQLGGGEYMAIDHNRQAIHIATPYDEIIIRLNSRLNGTYISYGPQGIARSAQQAAQDANAMEMEASVAVKRAVSKSSRLYSNESWDLVDAASQPGFLIAEIKADELPAELRDKTGKELQQYIKLKQEERISLQKQIREVNKKREAYIRENQKSEEGGLESAMIQAIKKQALKKDYHWR